MEETAFRRSSSRDVVICENMTAYSVKVAKKSNRRLCMETNAENKVYVELKMKTQRNVERVLR